MTSSRFLNGRDVYIYITNHKSFHMEANISAACIAAVINGIWLVVVTMYSRDLGFVKI